MPFLNTLASLRRRVMSIFYEALLLAAILWCGGLIFAFVELRIGGAISRPVFQAYLFFFAGLYFVWHWVRGQIPMRTWRMRLVTREGCRLTACRAMVRYVLATCGLALLGLGFLWAIFDREHQFLHDRLSGTRIVRC